MRYESIEEALRILISESDLEEVVCCLDMVATNDFNSEIKMFNKTFGNQQYPVIEKD